MYLYDWFDVRVGSKDFPDVMRGEEVAPEKLVFYESRRQKVRDGLRDFVIQKVKKSKLYQVFGLRLLTFTQICCTKNYTN